jgi:hypothetical protein
MVGSRLLARGDLRDVEIGNCKRLEDQHRVIYPGVKLFQMSGRGEVLVHREASGRSGLEKLHAGVKGLQSGVGGIEAPCVRARGLSYRGISVVSGSRVRACTSNNNDNNGIQQASRIVAILVALHGIGSIYYHPSCRPRSVARTALINDSTVALYNTDTLRHASKTARSLDSWEPIHFLLIPARHASVETF